MPQINSLPDIRSAGIKSEEFEEARRVHASIQRKAGEVEAELEALLHKLGRLQREDQRALAERWLSGGDDLPEAAALGELRAEVEAFKRRQKTLHEVAIPEAEGRVLNTVQYYRQDWAKQIVRDELPVRIRELREVLPTIQQTLAPKVYRLISALKVLEWCEGPTPGSYAPPQDQLTPQTVRGIEEFLGRLEAKLGERSDAGAEELEEVKA